MAPPTTEQWIRAMRELIAHPELPRIVVQVSTHGGNVWTYAAERQTNLKAISNNGKVIANTYFRTKLQNTETIFW